MVIIPFSSGTFDGFVEYSVQYARRLSWDSRELFDVRYDISNDLLAAPRVFQGYVKTRFRSELSGDNHIADSSYWHDRILVDFINKLRIYDGIAIRWNCDEYRAVACVIRISSGLWFSTYLTICIVDRVLGVTRWLS